MKQPSRPDYIKTEEFAGLPSGEFQPPKVLPSWAELPLFSGMSADARARFHDAMDAIDYADGANIITQGESGEDMYVLDSGNVRVTVRNDEDEVVFEKVVPAPAIFGEMALITHAPRTATLTVVGEASCLRIQKETVLELFAREPDTAVFLTRLVGERLMETQGIRRVGKYEVIGRLGAGGVATVFEAKHPQLGTPVALKMLSHALVFHEGFAEHFAEEARLVAQLQHDNIVRVLDTEQAYGTHFIVMEKLTGTLLEDLIYSDQNIGWQNTRRILREIAEALAYSHGEGFIHRDIKPENVFMLTDGRVKLMDFGIATKGGAGDQGKVLGTPYYMSPEQICGQPVDGRTDLYSLGILAYELVTRDVPFDADSIDALFACHIRKPLPDPRRAVPDLPDDLHEFIMRSTRKKPDDRFKDCAEAAAYLKAAAEVPVLDRFGMTTLSVTYHESRNAQVQQIMAEAEAKLKGVSGVASFTGHRWMPVPAAAPPPPPGLPPAAPPAAPPPGPPPGPPPEATPAADD